MFLIFNYFVRLWCAIQEFQQKVCSECPMELIALPNNNLVCNLWSELKQLQVCIFIALDTIFRVIEYTVITVKT